MTRLTPFGKITAVGTDRLSDLMDDFFGSRMVAKSWENDTFKLDIKENENSYIVEAELPGVKKEEISLELLDNTLNIGVNRETEQQADTDGYIHRERRAVSMRRGLYLADSCGEGIEARLGDGVLSVTVPKQAKPEPKKIEIQ